ncbi:MAG: sigma-70 family RNA polymerase sigma factor [Chitinophagaceae bacterium]|nr:sigma-70 family RNA polymerase sigma factor [Chitinophagaceae bacterium]
MKNTNTLNDDQLINLYLDGDANAFSILVNRHKSKIYTSIYLLVKDEHVAEDIFQDLFIRIIESLNNGAYSESGKFSSWAIRIAHNLCMDHYRKQKRSPIVKASEVIEVHLDYHISESGYDVSIIQNETGQQVRKLIDKLPEEQREIIILRHYANLSFKEIAALSNISINTALGRMRYALMNVRKMMPEIQMAC